MKSLKLSVLAQEMACETPATSHVQSIRSKFESLNILEPLDVTEPIVKKKSNLSIPLLRSATALDLRLDENLVTTRKRRNESINKGQSNEHFNDNYIAKADCEEDKLKPLKEIRGNVEIKLSRHTSDPIKRSSIKRSPAFRINGNNGADKGGNLQLSRSTSIPKRFANKIDNIVKWCVPDGSAIENSGSHGLTDTLKAALKQPLPKGPPPKKPPRSFELSSSESSSSLSGLPSPNSNHNLFNALTNRDEPIYMEPFSHSKFKNSVPPHVPEEMCRSRSEEKCSGVKTHLSCTSCPDHESLGNHGDSHYLVSFRRTSAL